MVSLRRILRKVVATVIAFSFLAGNLAWAQSPIADPTAPLAFRPSVSTNGGVPTVDIVNPTAGGVSHNKFTSYDVGAQGLVLNNSMVNGTSVLAGPLIKNLNLTAPAQVILNEVTGAAPSTLAGQTEVFGPAANVIVANPNGLTCDGCGFINAPRATLTTGTPTTGGGGAYGGLGFSVTSGTVAVGSNGLDGTGTDQVDLVGRRVTVNGSVAGASTLNVVGGASDYAYGTGTATVNASAPAAAGSYAIDASALGAMEAGKVRLIGTEAGVGVRALGGVAATADDLTITSDGNIVVSGVSANRDVTLAATGAVTAGGITEAGRNLSASGASITTSGTETVTGTATITATGNATLGATATAASLTATAGDTLAHTGSTTVTGDAALSGQTVTTAGTLSADGDLSVAATGNATLGATATATNVAATAGGTLAHAGSTTVTGDAALAGQTVTTAGTLSAEGDLSVAATGNATLGATATAASLTATAGGTLAHTGSTTVTGAIALSGQTVTTAGTLSAEGDLSVAATGNATLGATTTAANLTALAGGTLAKSGTLTLSGIADLSGASVTHAGVTTTDGDVSVTATNGATIGGAIVSSGDFSGTAGTTLTVSGIVTADGNASVQAANIAIGADGAVSSGGALTATATSQLTNQGVLDAGANLSATAAAIVNSGETGAAGAVALSATGTLNNDGGSVAGDTVAMSAGSTLSNTLGNIEAQNGIALQGAAIGNNQGFVRSESGPVSLTTAGALDNRQGAVSGTNITVATGTIDNAGGEAIADGDLSVTTTGALSNKGGTLFGNGAASVTSGGIIDNTAQGAIGSVGALTIAAQGNLDNTGGTISTNDTAQVQSNAALVQGGSLTAGAALQVIGQSVTNKGYTASADTLDVTSTTTLTNESGQMVANNGVTLSAGGAVDNRATVQSGVDLSVTAASLTNTASGRLEANRNLAAATTGAVANSGVVAANGTVSVTAGTSLANTRGSVLSGSDMTLAAATSLTNRAGILQSGGNMTVTAASVANIREPISTTATGAGGYRQSETSPAATMTAGGALTVTAASVLNEASLMSAGGPLTVTATTFQNLSRNLTTVTAYAWQSCSRTWYGKKKCHTNYSYSTSYTQTPSLVYTAANLAANVGTLTNTGTIQANKLNAVTGVLTNGIVDWTVKTMPAATPASRIDLSAFAPLPESTPGLFDLTRDAASRYQLTATVQLGALVDHDTLLDRLGPAADPNARFFADPFAETEMLRRAAMIETGQRFFVREARTDEEQRQILFDNAVAFAGREPALRLGEALTQAQIAALDRPILWYVDGGDGVLRPEIYLPRVEQANLTYLAGGRIIAGEADLQVAGAFTNTGFVNVANALTIDAGSILNEQRIARDTEYRIVRDKKKVSVHAVEVNSLQQGGEITAGSATLRSAGDITVSGGRIATAGDLALDAWGDVAVAAARVENHERVSAKRQGWEIDSVVNHAALVAAGLELSVMAGGDVAVAGSKLTAGADLAVAAGGDVAVAAAVDTLHSHGWTKKKSSSSEGTLDTVRHQGAAIESTGGAVDVWAGGDLAVQASRVAAAGDVALTADQGAVALLAGTDSTFSQQKHDKKGLVWQSSRDRGESATDVVMTELEAGGQLAIDAAAGVVADYRSTGSLEASLAALAQDPRTAWVTEVAKRNDVTWRAVSEAYQSWDHKAQGLSGPAALVIAIAVTVATQGAGAALVSAASGTTLAAGSMTAIANAGFSALVSQAAVSLANNQGNLGKVLAELGSAAAVKNLAVAMATAGAFAEVGTLTDGHFGTEGVNTAGQTPLDYLGTANHAANVAGHALVGCASAAAGGGDCASGALAAGVGAAAGPAVAGMGEVPGLIATSAVGGVASELGGGKFEDGAWTAALGYLFNEVAATYDRKTKELSVRDLDTGEEAKGEFFSGGTLFGDEIPAGKYAILQRGDKDGFRLEAMDPNFGDDIHNATGRSLLRLHGPGRSTGCITACEQSDWNPVRELIRSTSTNIAYVNTYYTITAPMGKKLLSLPIGREKIKSYGILEVK